jgi:aldehyde dehydrogenase (NAD+)
MAEALAVAKQTAELITVGDPTGDATLGPVVSSTQWSKINGLIKRGVEEGATLVAGGPNRPEGLDRGYFVKPTVFGNVSNDMTIAREEILARSWPFSAMRALTKPSKSAMTPCMASPPT